MPTKEPTSHIKKLAHFDLDGTLIDEAYQLTDAGINRSVETAKAKGWTVGLSSDSPYESLARWREQLGMNGPIIAERGAVVEAAGRLIFDTNTARRVSLSRTAIADYLSKRPKTTVWHGDSTEVIRQNSAVGEAGQRCVLINNLSRCSLRFYVRYIADDGRMLIDNDLTQETISELSPLYPEIDQPSLDNNAAFGLVIIGDDSVNKRTGLLTLLHEHPYERRVMVGNSMGDFIGDDLVEQYAVANADTDYLQRSRTANRPYTSGCIDILDSLC